MIRLQKLTLIRGTKPLLESADLSLNPGEKIGLIGANGSGKSSLFALLRGEIHADAGDVDFPASWRIAHVAQETPALERPALDYAIDGDTTLRRLETELADAEARHDGHKIGELHTALADADARFVSANLKRTRDSAMLVISGTLPPFAGDAFYVGFVRAAADAGVEVVIDSQKAALINVLFERPLLAKLTVRELESTLGEPMTNERRILRGMRDLMGMGAQNVFVTQGGKAAYLLTSKQAWRLTPPAVAGHVNPIGSGDCATAGIVHALMKRKRLLEAVSLGLACGSANVESLTPADLDVRRVLALKRDRKSVV